MLRILAAALLSAAAVFAPSFAAAQPAGPTRTFQFQCDINGAPATLVAQLEIVSQSGVTWGPGPTPGITGVIGTGEYTIYSAGVLRGPRSNYSFRGENAFADFTNMSYPERFRVKFVPVQGGVVLIVNPFVPQHRQDRYLCRLTAQR